MGLVALTHTAEMVGRMGESLSETDKEYVVQFAFRTGDGELTNKLIDELIQPGADRKAVFRRFGTMVDFRPDWIRKIEELLVSLERYRVQEEKTLKVLSEVLAAYGISLTEAEIRKFSLEKFREYHDSRIMDKPETVQR